MFKLYAKGTSSFDDITDYLSRDSLIIDEQLQEKANVCSFDMEANPVKEGQEIKIWDVVSVVDTTSLKTVKVDKLYDEVKKFRKGENLWLDINGANEEKVEIVSVNTFSNTITITTASNTHSIGSLVGIKKFAGNVSNVQNVNQHQLKNIAYFVKAFDYTKEFDRANINDSWTNKTAKEIIDEFVREKVNVGLTEQFTTSEVMTGSIFSKVSAPFTKPMELMRRLSGEEGFSWWIDYDKTIHYKPFLEEVAPFKITTASNNFVDLKIDTDITMVKNRQIVLGGFEDSLNDVVEFHRGDGSKREWVLRAKFSDLRIAVGTNSASMTTASVLPDFINEAGTADYFSNFTMQSVRADEGTPTLATTSLIKFLYREKIPINVLDEDPTSIARLKALGFADGVMEGRPIIDKSIKSRAEAQDVARGELLKYGNPIINATFRTDLNGLKAGQAIRITDPFRKIDDDFLIQRVREKVYAGDNSVIEATCASTLFGINELIRKLLESDTKIDLDSDINIDLIKLIREEIGFTSSWERKDDNVQTEAIDLTSKWREKKVVPPFVWAEDLDGVVSGGITIVDDEIVVDGQAGSRIATPLALDMNKLFSLSMWIKRTEAWDGTTYFADKFRGYSGGRVMIEQRTTNRLRFRYGASGDGHVLAPTLDLDTYHHIVWIHRAWDGTKHSYSVYKDNVLVGTEEWSGDEKTNTDVFDIGRASTAFKSYDISTIQLFVEKELSVAEITAIYTAGKDADFAVSSGLTHQYSGRDYLGPADSPTKIKNTAPINKMIWNLFEWS